MRARVPVRLGVNEQHGLADLGLQRARANIVPASSTTMVFGSVVILLTLYAGEAGSKFVI